MAITCGVQLTNSLHLSSPLPPLPLTRLNEIQRDFAFFGALRKIAKGDCQLRHVSLSVRPYGKTPLPLDGFS